jgi:uncharacterized protein (DUF488 family)
VTVWTVGHSGWPVAVFLDLLRGQGVAQIADVRRYPGSRAHPQYNPTALRDSLAAAGIDYLPFTELGGRRNPRPDSTNTVWRNAAFRGYADFMETPEFEAGLTRLIRAARECPTAMLCAEAVWWRCHRALIADALKAKGIEVLHILAGGKVVPHPYTSAASIVDGKLRYGPGPD